METRIRKFGNSKGAIIPAPLLKELDLNENALVDARAENGRLIIEPITQQKEYSLIELLEQCNAENMSLDDEDRAWLDSEPVGRERVE